MEKTAEVQLKEKQSSSHNMVASNPLIWDCESSLYDSFELKSLERQLCSAIISSSSRTLSMPHTSDRSQPQTLSKKTSTSKIARSFQKLFKSVFRHKKNNVSSHCPAHDQSTDKFYVFYDETGELTKIPEVLEYDGLSPEISSLVRRTTSERFTAASVSMSCA